MTGSLLDRLRAANDARTPGTWGAGDPWLTADTEFACLAANAMPDLLRAVEELVDLHDDECACNRLADPEEACSAWLALAPLVAVPSAPEENQ